MQTKEVDELTERTRLTKLTIFVSYTRDTRASLQPVLDGLRRLGHTVWFDEELTGGDQWWARILQQIREADVFLAALSPSYFESTACLEESRYAIALHKTILPVAIQPLGGSVVPEELTQLQIVDYSGRTDRAAFDLAAAVHTLPPHGALPEPLPPPPRTPLTYGPETEMIKRPELSFDQQMDLANKLTWHVNHEPREDQREAAVALLKQLGARPDISMRASDLISKALEEHASHSGTPPPKPQPSPEPHVINLVPPSNPAPMPVYPVPPQPAQKSTNPGFMIGFVTIVCLFFFAPLALVTVWYTKWSTGAKVAVAVLAAVISLIALLVLVNQG